MHRASSPRSSASRTFIEPLEGRQFLSVAPTATPQAVIAKPATTGVSTKTSIAVNKSSLLIGQTITITIKVKPAKGTTVARGTVQLLDGTTKTGATATLNHKGYAVLTFDPGRSIFVGTYHFAARFVSSTTKFIGSKSKATTLTVGAPSLTTTADGLQYATVTAGTGTGAKTGQSLTAQYTGFYATDGSVFDDSAAHSPGTFTFTLYSTPEQVITGFDEGTKGMKVGETRVLVIPSAIGYNDGKVRIFVIHLVSLK